MVIQLTVSNTFIYDTDEFIEDDLFDGPPTTDRWIGLFKDMAWDQMSDYQPHFEIEILAP